MVQNLGFLHNSIYSYIYICSYVLMSKYIYIYVLMSKNKIYVLMSLCLKNKIYALMFLCLKNIFSGDRDDTYVLFPILGLQN